MQLTDRTYKGVLLLLFLFTFVYVLLRAILTDPLHDEIATYIFYFYHGDYIGPNTVWDANNHLLNSFVGHQLYKIFGDNLFILRLPNLLAFIGFFAGVVKLTKQFKTPLLKLLSVFSLICIPFILEYFGFARGYALSLAFFVWGFAYFFDYQKNQQLKELFLCYLFLLLAVSANLTLINSIIIILGLAIISPFLAKEKRTRTHLIKKWALHLFCVLGLLPFIAFGIILKETGALYYGNLSGLWEVTGKSLSEMVLFTNDVWVKFMFVAMFIAFSILFIQILKKTSFNKWLKQPFILIISILYGNIIAILILAKFLMVNYPEDRTGMYLIILVLLAFFHFLENIRIGKWLQLSLLFFPISFLFHFSTDTSIVTPAQRMNHDFYLQVKKQITPEHSITIYNTMNWNWPYAESHQDQKASVAQFENPNSILYDIIVTRSGILKNKNIPLLYDTIAAHPTSGYVAFKRKEPLERINLQSYPVEDIKTSSDYYTLTTIHCEEFKGKNLQIDVSGHLKTFDPKNKIQLIVHVTDANGESNHYLFYSFEACFQGSKIDADFLHHFIIENTTVGEKEINIYLWNRSTQPFELSNSKVELVELKTREDELR